jgi:hypothetical protein
MKMEERARVRRPRAFYTKNYELREYNSKDAIYMQILNSRFIKRKEYLPLKEYLLRVNSRFVDKSGNKLIVALTTEHLEILDHEYKSKFCVKIGYIH